MKYLPFAALIIVVLMPDLVSAATVAPGGLVPCEGPDCSICSVVQMGNTILKWLIGVLMVIFAIMAAAAGFGLVTSGGNPEAKTAAKKKMNNAIIGLVIVLAGWLIIDTLMKALLVTENGSNERGEIEIIQKDGSSKWTPWSTIDCTGHGQTGGAPMEVILSNNVVSPNTTGLTQSNVKTALDAEGIRTVSTGVCTDPSNSTCTGLEGMQQETVDAIIDMTDACASCNLVVTAGTEIGHKNACHQGGTCADIDCRPADGATSCSIFDIARVTNAAASSPDDLNAVYEVVTQERKDALLTEAKASGVVIDPDKIDVVPWIKGTNPEHFSLYTPAK